MRLETESYLEFGSRARMSKIGKKYCEAKRDAKRVVYGYESESLRLIHGEIDSCFDGYELVRTANQRVGEKLLGLSCLKDGSKCGLSNKNLEGAHGKFDEC